MEWSSQHLGSHSIKPYLRATGIGVLLFLFSSNVYALDFATALKNLSKIINPLTSMVLVLCFCIGIFMIFNALTKMKKFGQLASYHSQPGEFGGPLVSLIVGALLVYLPTSTDYLMNSLFQTANSMFSGGSVDYSAYGEGSSLLSYASSSSLGQQWTALANTLVLFIQFLGFLSFVRGLIMLSKAATPGGNQQGMFAKGVTHVVGGVILINFVGAVNVIQNTIMGQS